MSAILACVVLVGMAVSGEALKPCCTPDQWTGSFGEQVGYNKGGKGGLSFVSGTVTYDYTNTRLAMRLYMIDGPTVHNVRTIVDYKQKMSYTIDLDKSKCYKMKTKSPMQQYCIPKNAKHTTELVFGAADDTLKGESWQFNIDTPAMKGQVAATVTTKDCIPIGELIFGKANDVGFMANVGFFNTTLNIRDPSVFKVPASCDDMDLSILISGRPRYAVQSNMLTRFGL